ncbi:dnaJ homolog subfamily C member 17 [Sitodiplosis mosellana]|uniref:dnaJ homolog subfamily C member 17 n=1 Tax=Sitodiplosis mosellana TaxID=263140 RepID=UPI0024446E44|nr:dnaJ homolog subfamily C member 17 [Sitodiplosis mosellana]
MVDVKKFANIDLYGLIGVEIGATQSEIRKAYRKKALVCHPDKNPDNPKAAELFHELASALEILTDESARAAYDRVLNAKKAAALRHAELDSKRRKLIEDLERREKEANSQQKARRTGYAAEKSPEEQLKDEMDRLRKEGSRLLEEEQEMMRKQLAEERLKMQESSNRWDSSQHRIKIKWKADKGDNTNGGYNETILRNYLKKYGDIIALVISGKKKGSAVVEFKAQDAAEMAVDYEKGNMDNPLTLEWIGNAPKNNSRPGNGSSTITDTDFESLVLRQMRQAEERKKLIEQMMREDGDE